MCNASYNLEFISFMFKAIVVLKENISLTGTFSIYKLYKANNSRKH